MIEMAEVDTKLKQKYYEPENFKFQFKEILTDYSKFLFQPGKKDEELKKRDFLFNRLRSKRKFASKLNNTLTKIGFIAIFVVISWAVFAPWVARYNYFYVQGIDYSVSWYDPPSAAHPFGVSKFGRDVLSRLIWGARSSLSIGLIAIVLASVFGVIVGILSAYQGGLLDSIVMRIVDIIMAFPGLIMIIIIVSILGNEMYYIMLIYGILGIPGYARLIRGSVLQEKTKTYVEASKVSGSSDWRIMFRHILPNCIAPVIVAVTFNIGGIILSLAGLSFLGFGDYALIEWGSDINIARSRLTTAPWASIWPGVGIFITVLGFMLLGDGLRDALDPRLQGKKKK
jgi:ABC-type dipeptide/oligopeptide/nickel transport system permease subunit